MATLGNYAGFYQINNRSGGQSGTWYSIGTLIVMPNGSMYINNTLCTLSSMSSQNEIVTLHFVGPGGINGNVSFTPQGSAGYFFNQTINSNVVTGFYDPNSPGSGGMDFMGIMTSTEQLPGIGNLPVLLQGYGINNATYIPNPANNAQFLVTFQLIGLTINATFTNNSGNWSMTFTTELLYDNGAQQSAGVMGGSLGSDVYLRFPMAQQLLNPPIAVIGAGVAGYTTAPGAITPELYQLNGQNGLPEVQITLANGQGPKLDVICGVNLYGSYCDSANWQMTINKQNVGAPSFKLNAQLNTLLFAPEAINLNFTYQPVVESTLSGWPIVVVNFNNNELANALVDVYNNAPDNGCGPLNVAPVPSVPMVVNCEIRPATIGANGLNLKLQGNYNAPLIGIATVSIDTLINVEIPVNTLVPDFQSIFNSVLATAMANYLVTREGRLQQVLNGYFGPDALNMMQQFRCKFPAMA